MAVRKIKLATVDGTPKKRLFLSIISDYDLKTGVCELVDNALDLWITNQRVRSLQIDVTLDVDRQVIQVCDNAGGVSEDNAELLISPGASRNDQGKALIGVFGVGGKRAGIALGELVEIRTRHEHGKSVQVDLDAQWINSPSWDLDIYEIPSIEPNQTVVDISKIRQSFEASDIDQIRRHLAETYGRFLGKDCVITLNGSPIEAVTFESWAYPPDYLPREASFAIEPVAGRFLNVCIIAGLILDRDPEEDNYGIYFYCNERLVVKELRARDVGYFVTAEAGVPHPDASLARVIVKLSGSAELMPWNSSKSGINFSHPAFLTIRQRVIDFCAYYTKVSRRLKRDWQETVFAHRNGKVEQIDPVEALSTKKRILPNPPGARSKTRMAMIKELNDGRLRDQPWTLGLVEAIGIVEVLSKQHFDTRNRAALILLDSNFEIALKEFIVHRKDLFPAHKYTNIKLAQIFGKRSEVIQEVKKHVVLSNKMLAKISHYYEMRNNFVHQRATVSVSDSDIDDYRGVVETVLNKLFRLKFPD